MAKFVVVNKAPEKLDKGEIVIGQPDFLEQIRANTKKAPKHGQTGINHLREVLNSVGQKYDPEMNVYKIRMLNYEGLPFKTDQDLSAIVNRIFKAEYPAIYDKYLEHEIQKRPMGTKLIHYVGDFNSTGPFYKAGLDLIEQKDVESYLTGKPKKTVGKPAITDEEAEGNDSN
jgi:hypothetical protein